MMIRRSPMNFSRLCATLVIGMSALASPCYAERIRDVCRIKTEVPNELVGMGIVVGLAGTGDGGDFKPTMRPLKEMMKRFDDPIAIEAELKNVKNVAIVTLSIKLPAKGAHSGEELDVKVSAIAAKSLKGGRLFIVPMFAPRTDAKVILASASGELMLDDETHPTEATIHKGGVLIEDVLPEETRGDQFVLVLDPKAASYERASAVADTINQEMAALTGGKAVAIAMDATSVLVEIPPTERAHPTNFIGLINSLPLPNLPEPAVVRINTKTKTIVFTDEVELAPTMISQNNLSITIDAAGAPVPNAAGTKVPFVTLDPKKTGNAKLKDLENAFNLLKVSADDRIAIIKELSASNVLKAKLIID